MKKLLGAALLASAGFASLPAQAATTLALDCNTLGVDGIAIGLNDINPSAQACVGYFDKNVLNTGQGNFASADEVAALNALGLTGEITVLEKLTGNGDFETLLNGTTWIGVHYGRGDSPVDVPGGVTAFYRFDAGTNLDAITINSTSISGVVLYATGAAVPEPSTWAMLFLGFGVAGAAMRRRATKVQFA